MTNAPSAAENMPESCQTSLRVLLAGYMALLVLLIVPVTPQPAIDSKVLATHIMAWLLLVGILWLGGRERRILSITPLHVLILGWFGVSFVAAYRSALPLHSFVEVSKLASLCALFLVASNCYRHARDIRGLAAAVCAAMAISSISTMIQVALSDRFDWNLVHAPDEVFPGTFGNPNFAIHAIVLCVILTLWLASQPKWRWTILFLIPYGIHHYLVGHRGGLVGLAAGGLLVLVARFLGARMGRPAHGVIVTLVAFLVIGGIAMASVMGFLHHRYGAWLPLDDSSVARYHTTACGMKMVADRPLLGFGPGMYFVENPSYWTAYEQYRFAGIRRMHQHVHNDIVESVVEIGLVGALFHIGVLVTSIVMALLMAFSESDRLNRRLGYALAALFTTFAVDGFFGFNLRVPVTAAMFFVMLGVLAGVKRHQPTLWRMPVRHPVAWALCALMLANLAFGLRVYAAHAALHSAMVLSGAGAETETVDARIALAERLAPWDWRISFQRGLTERSHERPDLSIQHLQRSLTRNPYYLPAHLALSQGFYNLGAALQEMHGSESDAWPLAHQAIHQADMHADFLIRLCPPLPEPYDMKARIAIMRAQWEWRDGQPDQATDHWLTAEHYAETAIRLGARRPNDLILILYHAALQRGDHEEAVNALVRGVRARWADADIEARLQDLATASP